ncbi:MAG: hypothetical protein UY50_C0030G0007 [Parcubacteria group bacterium GW2011_GWA2_49_9]|nr:MAG: hypothetical protein UY50_C0030G0007 [Parcubacteria group bacterium GW2011_GWA2_49_9]
MQKLLGFALVLVILLIIGIPRLIIPPFIGELSLLVYRPVHYVTVPPGQTVYFPRRSRTSSYGVSADGPVSIHNDLGVAWPRRQGQIILTSVTNRVILVTIREKKNW